VEEGDGEELGVAREVGVGGEDGGVVEVGGGGDGHVDGTWGDAVGTAGVVELGGEGESFDIDGEISNEVEALFEKREFFFVHHAGE